MATSGNYADIDLSGQVGLVTGGGRGLGRAIARYLAAAGMAVAVMARSQNELDESVALIAEAGGRAIAYAADVTDRVAIERLVAETERQFGPIDLLVNNAGSARAIGPVSEVDPDTWWRDLEINLRGPFLCSHAVLPGMVARGKGRVINVSSYAGIRPYPNFSAYACSKAGLLRLNDTMDAELKSTGVKAFAVTPGWTKTAMADYLMHSEESKKYFADQATAEINWREPEQLAELCVFFASGRGDSLSGRFVNLSDDLDDLLRRSEEIEREDLYALRLRK